MGEGDGMFAEVRLGRAPSKVGGWVRKWGKCLLSAWLLLEIVVLLLAAYTAVVARRLAVSAGVTKTFSSRPRAGGRFTPSVTV